MQEYVSAHLRNVAVIGHGRSGKTSLLDACLFNAGAVKRLGSTANGSSFLDVEPEELRRGFSISSKLVAIEWHGCKLNFIDTPGYPDFISEVKEALAAADCALIVISAPSGIEIETEKGWRLAEETGMPRAFFVNKMDREHADFQQVVDELRVRFGKGVVPVQLPIGAEASFQGVADLLTMNLKFMSHEDETIVTGIPEYMEETVETARQALIEALADFNDTLLEKFLGGEAIAQDEIGQALSDGIAAGKVFPVFCGSASQNIGIRKLMNGIISYLPAPGGSPAVGTEPGKEDSLIERTLDGPFSAQVFKTIVDPFVGRLTFLRLRSGELCNDDSVYNASRGALERLGGLFTMQGNQQIKVTKAFAGDIVVTSKLAATQTGDTLADKNAPICYEPISLPGSMLIMAAYPKKKGDEEKVFGSLEKEQDEDPTIVVFKFPETKETLVRAQGEVQIEILGERLARKFGAEIEFREPKVPYRETIRKSVKTEGKHKKQSGGHGQYGHVWLEISPQPAGEGNVFTETIFGGSVPRQYIPAVEKGTAETLAGGVLAGCPVVDIKVNLYDGSYHTVDSSEAAFKAATALALRKGIKEAQPVLLEPIYNISISAPEYFMGEVMGQLNAKRARIMGVESQGRDMSEVKAQIPATELYKYATDLRAQTKGRGAFTTEFSHYEEMPPKMAEKVIQAYQDARK